MSLFADSSDKAIYEFRSTPSTETETPPVVTDTLAANNVNESRDATQVSEEKMVLDAQESIKEKLIEKYQVRLDKVITSISAKISLLSADDQRSVLTKVQETIQEKRQMVEGKTMDPLQKDITLILLDHISQRLDGLLQQAAQVQTQQTQTA